MPFNEEAPMNEERSMQWLLGATGFALVSASFFLLWQLISMM